MTTPEKDYKQILQTWAEKHDISPTALMRYTGYSYQHAWDLLRGTREVNEGTIGRILTKVPSEIGAELYQAISDPSI